MKLNMHDLWARERFNLNRKKIKATNIFEEMNNESSEFEDDINDSFKKEFKKFLNKNNQSLH